MEPTEAQINAAVEVLSGHDWPSEDKIAEAVRAAFRTVRDPAKLSEYWREVWPDDSADLYATALDEWMAGN